MRWFTAHETQCLCCKQRRDLWRRACQRHGRPSAARRVLKLLQPCLLVRWVRPGDFKSLGLRHRWPLQQCSQRMVNAVKDGAHRAAAQSGDLRFG